MKSVVLGGNGFIGSKLVEKLLLLGNDVVSFDVNPPQSSFTKSSRLTNVVGDFSKFEDIQKGLTGADIVFHLVSTTKPSSADQNPIFDIQTNLFGTLTVLDAMVAENVKRIVFVSSGGTVYGHPLSLPISEDHPTNPISSYGITKLMIEKHIGRYQIKFGIDYLIARISNVYGATKVINVSQGVIENLVWNSINRNFIEIWGDGSIIRDYVYISDVINALYKLANYHGDRRIFNIGTGIGTSVNNIISVMTNLGILHSPLSYKSGRNYDVSSNILDISLAKEELGWEPEASIIHGIQKVYNDMIDQSLTNKGG
jgi:UDP-glucose 4-epimerase